MENKKFTAVALGFFDGVHLGHQSIIKETLKYESQSVIPVVYTFRDSPKQNLSPDTYFYLTDNEKKTKLLLNYGIKKVYMDNFLDVKNLSCEEFVDKIIRLKLNAKYVVCGENYSFGYKAQGNPEKLKNICDTYNIHTKIIPLRTYKGKYISSTRIKNEIELGNVKDAEKMLGKKFDKHSLLTTIKTC